MAWHELSINVDMTGLLKFNFPILCCRNKLFILFQTSFAHHQRRPSTLIIDLRWDDKWIYKSNWEAEIQQVYEDVSGYLYLTFEFDSLSAVAVNSTVFLLNKILPVICCQHVKSNLCLVLADNRGHFSTFIICYVPIDC